MKTLSWKSTRRVRRDYSRKRFENYMFRERHARHTSFKTRFLLALVALLLISAVGVQFSPFLTISDIKISGVEEPRSDEIMAMLSEKIGTSRRFLVFPQKNIIFFDVKEASRIVGERYPGIAEVKIEKTISRTLRVNIREHEKALILIESDAAFYLGAGGERITAVLPEYLLSDDSSTGTTTRITGIKEEGKKQLPILFTEASEETLASLVTVVRTLANELPKNGVTPASFQYDENDDTIVVVTNDGWRAYFDPVAEKLTDQIASLAAVLSKEVKSTKNLDYIDLRFENRVYYK